MKDIYNIMKIGFLMFFSLILPVALSAAPAESARIYNNNVPVITGNTRNVVCEIQIPDCTGGEILESVHLDIAGIDRKAVSMIQLYYSGTMSMVRSRTISYVMNDIGKKLGGGQDLYNNDRFVMEVSSSAVPASGKVSFRCGKELVKGDNYFFVSVSLDEQKVDLSAPFYLEITDIKAGGRSLEMVSEGSTTHRMGVKVRQHGDDGVYAYRIPGLVTTNSGTLIGVYDVRYSSSLDLQNDIDVGVSRSTDGGKTWEDMSIAIDMGEWGGLPEAQNGVGDPSVLVDEATGEIFIVAAWTHGLGCDRAWTRVGDGFDPINTAQLVIVSSNDDGKTWSVPRNITRQVKQENWNFTLQGPGRGITMEDGTLVFPLQYQDKDRLPSACIMYSKDHGRNWNAHTLAKTNTTESQVAEISPGVLMLNMRDNRKTGRAVYITSDLGKTWTEHPSSGTLREPVCQASLLNIRAEDNVTGRDILLFSNPDTEKGRNHTTLKASLDKGDTWLESDKVLLDKEENWGYSCLTQIDQETVGILYECSRAQLVFQAVKIRDIVNSIK